MDAAAAMYARELASSDPGRRVEAGRNAAEGISLSPGFGALLVKHGAVDGLTAWLRDIVNECRPMASVTMADNVYWQLVRSGCLLARLSGEKRGMRRMMEVKTEEAALDILDLPLDPQVYDNMALAFLSCVAMVLGQNLVQEKLPPWARNTARLSLLCRMLKRDGSPRLLETLVVTLRQLSGQQPLQQPLVDAGCVPVMLKRFACGPDNCRKAAGDTIFNLCLGESGILAVRRAGGAAALLQVMMTGAPPHRETALGLLADACWEDPAAGPFFLRTSGAMSLFLDLATMDEGGGEAEYARAFAAHRLVQCVLQFGGPTVADGVQHMGVAILERLLPGVSAKHASASGSAALITQALCGEFMRRGGHTRLLAALDASACYWQAYYCRAIVLLLSGPHEGPGWDMDGEWGEMLRGAGAVAKVTRLLAGGGPCAPGSPARDHVVPELNAWWQYEVMSALTSLLCTPHASPIPHPQRETLPQGPGVAADGMQYMAEGLEQFVAARGISILTRPFNSEQAHSLQLLLCIGLALDDNLRPPVLRAGVTEFILTSLPALNAVAALDCLSMTDDGLAAIARAKNVAALHLAMDTVDGSSNLRLLRRVRKRLLRIAASGADEGGGGEGSGPRTGAPPKAQEVKYCIVCGQMEMPGLVLQSCSCCRSVVYCGRACQTKHWPDHKADCKRRTAAAGKK